MSDAFDKWINSFSDEEYEEMIDDSNPFGFTDAQKSKALNIRQAPTPEELDDLTLEQEFTEEPIDVEAPTEEIPEPRARPILPRVKRARITQQEAPVDISSRTPITITRVEPSLEQPPTERPIQTRIAPPKPPTIRTRVRTRLLGVGKFLRRFFRV